MRKPMNLLLLILASCLWLSSPLTARALSLADAAAPGSSFTSLEGQLSFSNVDISDLVASGLDPERIGVVPIDFGFQLVPDDDDGVQVFNGRLEDPLLHFDVHSTLAIRGIHLSVEGEFEGPVASGPGSFVRVELSQGDPLQVLLMGELEDGQDEVAGGHAVLSPAVTQLSLWTRIDLVSGEAEGSARFPRIEYRFETEVPEPGTASLLLLGLACSGWLRRRS